MINQYIIVSHQYFIMMMNYHYTERYMRNILQFSSISLIFVHVLLQFAKKLQVGRVYVPCRKNGTVKLLNCYSILDNEYECRFILENREFSNCFLSSYWWNSMSEFSCRHFSFVLISPLSFSFHLLFLFLLPHHS